MPEFKSHTYNHPRGMNIECKLNVSASGFLNACTDFELLQLSSLIRTKEYQDRIKQAATLHTKLTEAAKAIDAVAKFGTVTKVVMPAVDEAHHDQNWCHPVREFGEVDMPEDMAVSRERLVYGASVEPVAMAVGEIELPEHMQCPRKCACTEYTKCIWCKDR